MGGSDRPHRPDEKPRVLQIHGRRLQSRLNLRDMRKLRLRSDCDRRPSRSRSLVTFLKANESPEVSFRFHRVFVLAILIVRLSDIQNPLNGAPGRRPLANFQLAGKRSRNLCPLKTRPGVAITLWRISSEQVKNEHDYCEHQQDMNGPGGNMERQKPKQPHDDENRSNDSKHLSLLLRLFNDAAPSLPTNIVVRIAARYSRTIRLVRVGAPNLVGTMKSGTDFSL